MSRKSSLTIYSVAEDGLPDTENTTLRLAFIFDGRIVSGWPIGDGETWEADSDVGRHGTFYGVTHYVIFDEAIVCMEKP